VVPEGVSDVVSSNTNRARESFLVLVGLGRRDGAQCERFWGFAYLSE